MRWPLDTLVGRRAILAAAALTAAPTHPALAWCGETFPSWAFYLKWDQNSVPFAYQGVEGSTSYRILGDIAREKRSGVPPILVVGCPGVGYEYLENLEALTVSDRRIVEVTFAGTAPGAVCAQVEPWNPPPRTIVLTPCARPAARVARSAAGDGRRVRRAAARHLP